ncbi:MAG: two pore domain potassium channel family protein [Deltaproteobacteria bacterium]|nr:two pore domain potassium channel family protein [Deltaproteobacteria bacterium]MBW2010775.1 two pore domain potassium channel family protein [Deltaproteobacteria bacterium]
MIFEKYFHGRFTALLFCIFCYLFIAPLLQNFPGISILMSIFITAILISGIYSVSQRKHVAVFAVSLALPMVISLWVNEFVPKPFLVIAGDFFGILFMTYLVVLILSTVMKAKEVTPDVIYGAIIVYLFIGIIWAFLFRILMNLQPGAFTIQPTGFQESRSLFSYFSFVTLTTLGYGDISPLSAIARSFTYLEAVIGQIYLTVLVARLVGIHISQSLEKK